MSIKSMSDVDNVLEQLKKTQTAIHVENIDITWDINNQFVISLEMLEILLTKTSCLPLVPDFTAPDLVEKLGINNEQATIIQNLNSELIYIHGLLQKLILCEYVTSSIAKEMIDNTISSLPQTDISNLLEFIKNYNDSKLDGIQTGGQAETLVKFFIFLLFFTCISSTSDINFDLVDPMRKTYSTGIVNYSPDQFTDELFLKPRITSGPVKVSGIIAEYDKEVDKEVRSLYGKISQFLQLSQPARGLEVLQEIATEFNKRSDNFSEQATKGCLELMVKCNDNKVFSQWTDIDSIDETQKKIQKLNEEVAEQVNNIQTEMTQDVTALAMSTAAATVLDPTTSLISVASYVSSLGVDLYRYLSVTNSLAEEKKKILEEQKTVIQQAEQTGPISILEKTDFESKIYEFSRAYCSLGYNLKVVVENDTIKVDGDKVPYISMINLITTLDGNLQLQITNLAASAKKDEKETRLTIAALMSLQQRLSILKKITESISYFVNRSAKISLMTTNDYPDANSIEQVKTFFNQQITDLNALLTRLNATFPIREQKIEENIKLLEDEKKLVEKAIDIKLLQEDIKDIKQNETAIITQRKTDRFIREGETVFNAAGTILQSWSDMGLNMTQGISDNLTKYTLAFTELAGAGPMALLDGILKFLNKVLFKLLVNPSFYAILMCGLLVLEFTIGGIKGKIRIFANATKQIFITIVTGPLVFVYKLIKTPFGYIWKQTATLKIDEAPRILSQSEEEAIQGLLALSKKGGKTRKTHKKRKNRTRRMHKNKKNTTFKSKHKKKHNTRYKKGSHYKNRK
jgi:hypothetical protein